MPSSLSAHISLSIPALDAFQLQLTPLNSTPTSLRTGDDAHQMWRARFARAIENAATAAAETAGDDASEEGSDGEAFDEMDAY